MSDSDIHEINREQWVHFFDKLSKDHEGKPVSMDAYGPGTNPHREVRRLPLTGITYEPRSDSIEFILGTERDDHLTHTVYKPTHVWVRRETSGDVLDVRAEDGLTFLLRLSTID
jgi:hypothetical protein